MMAEITKAIREATKFASCSSARLHLSTDNVTVTSTWSQPDIDRGEHITFTRTHVLTDDLQRVTYTGGASIASSSKKLESWSPSGNLCAVIITDKPDKEERFSVEIWDKCRRIRFWDLSAKDLHGAVYYDVQFGCLSWSQDEKKIVYVAEKKYPKPKYAFSELPSKEEGSSVLNEAFAYREDWGEQLEGKSHSVACVLTVESGDVEILEQIPETLSCGQVEFVDNSTVVGVAWEEAPYRLGVIYCGNRKSQLFIAGFDGTYDAVSEEKRSVSSPRTSPDGKCIIYLDQREGGPHKNTARLMLYDMEKKQNVVLVDVVYEWDGTGFAGLYLDSLPLRCWSNHRTILLTSTRVNQLVSYVISIDEKSKTYTSLQELPYSTNLKINDVSRGIILATSSNMTCPHHLVVGKLPNTLCEDALKNMAWKTINEVETPSWMKNITMDTMMLTSETGLKYNSLVLIPESSSTDIPWILFPHGGPHSVTTSEFVWNTAVNLYMGFGVILPNYVGSLGQGQKNVEALIGNIGKTDVKDVYDAGVAACNKYTQLSKINKFLYGGSHGGFINAHLMSHYPSEYKASALRNPVLDVLVNTGLSDIPDWNYEEAGIKFEMQKIPNVEDMLEMWQRSPYRLIDSVETPTLLLLGTEDHRVPRPQSFKYYKMLKARGVKTSIRLYPDNHALGKMSVAPDVVLSSLDWFLDHTQ